MAASNACSLSTGSFKMPSEPCPLPSLGSDEESFVILWKDSKSPIEEDHESGTSIVEEAKELINKELLQMEQLSLSHKTEISPQAEQSPLHKNQENSKVEQDIPDNTHSVSEMEKSTVLPKMPRVQRGFDTSDVISITTLSTDLSSEEVQKKVSQIVEENICLKDTILQNNMSMKSQYERIVAWQEDVQKVHQTHKEKIIEAKEFIERLKKENYNLTRDLEKLREIKNLQDEELITLKNTLKEKEKISSEELIKTTDDNMKEFELDISTKKVKELELAMRNMTLENANLKEDREKFKNDAAKIDQYEKQIETLQEALHISKLQIEETKMELLRVKSVDDEKQKSMSEVIESLRSKLQYMEQQRVMVPSPEEIMNIRQQLINTQVTLTQVEHSRAAAYAQVASLNTKLMEQADSQSHKDEMYALQTQLDVYKADFEAERSAKETLRAENEKLSEDMQNLHRRNQQLQEEIDMIRERDYVVYPPHRRDHGSAPSSSSSNDVWFGRFGRVLFPSLRLRKNSDGISLKHPMKCPKCSFGFKTFQALENHVNRCIDLDDSLP